VKGDGKEGVSETPDSLKEDYDYENKRASRLVIKRYLSQLRERGLIKPFNEQKTLILTHVDALDLKEILLPLGYRKRNIHIIEREKAVYDEMKKREFFRKCHLLNIDLIDYRKNEKFDLMYLDFKGNISSAFLEILASLIQKNSHSGTVFYLNLQMARETREISNFYDNLEGFLKYELGHISKEGEQVLAFISNVKRAAARLTNDAFIIEYLRRNAEIPSLEIRVGNEVFDIDFTNLAGMDEVVKKMEDYREKTNLKSYKLLTSSSNKHLMRIKLIEIFVKRGLEPWYEETFFPQDDERKADLRAITRYLAHSLVILHYRSFIYRSKANTPFLSILFTLRDENQYLRERGVDLEKKIMRGLLIFYLKGKGAITRSQITPMLDSYETIARLSKVAKLVDKGYIHEGSLDSRIKIKDLDKTLNARYNRLNLLFSELKARNFISPDKGGAKLSLNIGGSGDSIDARKALVYLSTLDNRSARVARWVLDLYLSLELLRKVDSTMEQTYDLKKSDIINLPDDFHLTEGNIAENVDTTLHEDKIASEIKRFSRRLKTQISLFESGVEISEIPEDLRRGIPRHRDSILSSLRPFLKLDRHKREGGRSKPMKYADLRAVVYSYIERHPEKKSLEISRMISEEEDIEVSDHQVRAFKYWHRQQSR
jgi:hypothetical protein